MALPRKLLVWIVPATAVLAGAASLWWFVAAPALRAADVPAPSSKAESSATTAAAASAPALHPVNINPGPATPTVRTNVGGAGGPATQVACSTCHTTRTPDVTTRTSAQLVEFHQGLQFAHGQLSCLSCHNASNYDTLRQADGVAIAFPDTIQLCAQCHGTHYRDYLHGSHGGMTGHWDLTAGPRARNMCTDCHDPHAPAFPRVQPVFPPQDRGARQQRARAEHGAAASSHE